MKARLSRRDKRHVKISYYALLDAVVRQTWDDAGYILPQPLLRRLRRVRFKRWGGSTLVYRRASGPVVLRLDGRAP